MNRVIPGLTLHLLIVLSLAAQQPGPKVKGEAKKLSKAASKTFKVSSSKTFDWVSTLSGPRMKPLHQVAEKAVAHFLRSQGITKNGSRALFDEKPLAVFAPNKRTFRSMNKWFCAEYRSFDHDQFLSAINKVTYWQTPASRNAIAAYIQPFGEKHMRAVTAHLVGHLLTNRLHFHNNFVPPWLEESTGIYYELQIIKRTACGCFKDPYDTRDQQGERKNTGTPKAKWVARVKRAFSQRQVKNIEGLFRPRLHEMTRLDVYRGWATVSWMMSQPKKYGEFLRVMKAEWPGEIDWNYSEGKGKAQIKAFQKVFKMTTRQVDTAVDIHVRKL